MNKDFLRKTAYVSFVVLFVLWMIVSNRVVHMFDRDHLEITETSMTNYPQFGKLSANIETIEAEGNLFESFSIRGWAFAEADIITKEQKTELILSGDKHCYRLKFQEDEVQQFLRIRNDVVNAFSDFQFATNEVGFASSFSSFDVENGLYDIYVYCYEESGTYGFVPVGKQIVKDGTQIQMQDWVSTARRVDTVTGETGDDVQSHLDYCELKDDILAIKGWVIKAGINSAEQRVYVKLNDGEKDACYNTLAVVRSDIADCFCDENYTMSGYAASIPLESLQDSEWEVTVLLEVDGVIYQDQPRQLKIENGEAILM